MNIRRIIREEIDDLQWIKDIEPSGVDLMLNKAFYFNRYKEDFGDNLEVVDAINFVNTYL